MRIAEITEQIFYKRKEPLMAVVGSATITTASLMITRAQAAYDTTTSREERTASLAYFSLLVICCVGYALSIASSALTLATLRNRSTIQQENREKAKEPSHLKLSKAVVLLSGSFWLGAQSTIPFINQGVEKSVLQPMITATTPCSSLPFICLTRGISFIMWSASFYALYTVFAQQHKKKEEDGENLQRRLYRLYRRIIFLPSLLRRVKEHSRIA